LGRYLTERHFAHILPVTGAVEYQPKRGEGMTLAVLQRYQPHQRDAWSYALDSVSHFLERALATAAAEEPLAVPGTSGRAILALVADEIPPLMHEMDGAYLEMARLLGQRTAEMHESLGLDTDNPAFTPEPFSTLYQRSVYQSMRSLTGQVLQALRKHRRQYPGDEASGTGPAEDQILSLEGRLLERFRAVVGRKIRASRIRIHGDYGLHNVLFTGRDFIITNFGGEPNRPASAQRIKRSPLRDVASMLVSINKASYAVLYDQVAGSIIRPEHAATLEPWACIWRAWVGATFLGGYLAAAEQTGFLPTAREDLQILLDAFLLEQAISELGQVLANRPDRLRVPLNVVLELAEE
jgi:maltose alpha-D-glucosyltransferase/alpha-amylase